MGEVVKLRPGQCIGGSLHWSRYCTGGSVHCPHGEVVQRRESNLVGVVSYNDPLFFLARL